MRGRTYVLIGIVAWGWWRVSIANELSEDVQGMGCTAQTPHTPYVEGLECTGDSP